MRLLFEERAHAVVYRDHRVIPRFVIQQYLGEILSHVNPGNGHLRILDVGCGTGAFATAFAKHLPSAEVRGVDASAAMTAMANELIAKTGLHNIVFENLDVGEAKIEGDYDVVVCSEMIHLVDRPHRFLQVLSESLRPGGVIAIRTSSLDQIAERHWYRYFPTARIADLERYKSIQLLTTICENLGYKTEVLEIDESRSVPTKDYLSMFVNRCFSTLYLISEKEFEDGIRLMHRELDSLTQVNLNYRMSLFIATNLV